MERPQVKPLVRLQAIKGGLLITHADDGIRFTNEKVAILAAKLIGEIDGSRTTQQLIAAVPESVRPLLETILFNMTDKEMLIEAASGKVAPEVVESDIGVLARTFGGDWEERLRQWTMAEIAITGPDLRTIEALKQLISNAGALVVNEGFSAKIEVRAVERPTVIASKTPWGMMITAERFGAVSVQSSSEDRGPGNYAKSAPLESWWDKIVLSSIARHALLAALAPEMIIDEVVHIDQRGLTHRSHIEAGGELTGDILTRSDPMADTAVWLSNTNAFAAGSDVQPAFPLAHRSIRLMRANGETGGHILEWGLTPQEADERALKAAQVQRDAEGGKASQRCDWIRKRQLGEPSTVDAANLEGRANLLWRISESYLGLAPTVQTYRWGAEWIATAILGVCRGDCVNSDKHEAIATAIGNALSAAQTGVEPTGQQSIRWDAH
jgi:hypothetical protein